MKQKKKVYAKKYNLCGDNIYNNAFNYLNNRIKQEIKFNKRKNNSFLGQKDEFFDIKRYNHIYNNNSNKLLKLLKNKKGKAVNKSSGDILKKIDEFDIKKKNIGSKSFRYFRIKPKVYNHDDKLKSQIKRDRVTKSLRIKYRNLKNKFNVAENSVLLNIASSFNIQEKRSIKFSKTAYLASLNYDFRDPLSTNQ